MLRILIIIIALSLNAKLAHAGELTQYPPYPDVWGYDFSSRPETRIVNVLLSVYKIENGDYWFELWDSISQGEIAEDAPKQGYAVIKFFAQETRLQKYIGNKVVRNVLSNVNHRKITFSNGESLEIDESSKNNCWDTGIRDISFIKKDANGKELGRYAIILASSHTATMKPDDNLNNCSIANNQEYGPDSDNEVFAQLHPIAGGMILLKDDTFLLYDDVYIDSVVVRFKQDLTTPYSLTGKYRMYNGKTLTKKIFVIPYQIIASLAAQAHRANQPVAQALQNRLIDFLADDYPLLQK